MGSLSSALCLCILKFRLVIWAMKPLSLEYKISTKDINLERSQIIKELQQINDISLLKAVKHLIHYGLKNDGHISIEQYNKELEEAEAEMDKGEFITHHEH
jgi:hypothetical protein